MAKKTKDPAAAPAAAKKKKEPKVKAPVDPAKTRELIRLVNILALLLAIAAFLLQLFAVLTHHWKWQVTGLKPIVSPTYHYSQPNIYNDSRLGQTYGLFSRKVRLYANNDEQLDLYASTRFPRVDDDNDTSLHQCLSHTSTLRGAFLTCSDRVVSAEQCNCRRYTYWNFVIFFEILALILLGLAVVLTALLTTQFHGILKPAGAGLSLLAFLLLLIGLILILSHLKRETRSLADAYPHIYQRLSDKLSVVYDPYGNRQRNPTALRRAVRRQVRETYRVYSLLPGQHSYNDTHFQEYSEQARAWVYKPYASLGAPVPYSPLSQQGRDAAYTAAPRYDATVAPTYSQYGPLLGYDKVFENTYAWIGWSTVLSIIAMILSLLLPLLLVFSWLTNKKLEPSVKKVKTTTVKTDYVAVPQEIPAEEATLVRTIPADYNPNRPIGDAIVTTQNVPQRVYDARQEPVIVRDVVIRDEQPPQSLNAQETTVSVTNETATRT